jgi:hypothetical protein
MSAGEAREELEGALWHRMPAGTVPGVVDALLALADAYAEEAADERIAGRVLSRSLGRQRLAEAAAGVSEAYGHMAGMVRPGRGKAAA